MDRLVVELLGARGTGKSTLKELILAELQTRNLAADLTLSRGLGDKLARQLFTLADRSRFVYTSLIWRPLSIRDLHTFRRRYRRLRLSALSYAGRPGVRLIDEGVFQLIMELKAKTAQKDICRIADRIARLIPFPDLVVLVESTEEAIEERRMRRGNDGDILRPRVVPWERAALDHTRKLLVRLAASGTGPEVLVVRNGDDADLRRAAERVADVLAARYRERSGRYQVH